MKIVSGNCALCGTFREVLQRDHIVPKAMGGGNEPSNLQLICANCHQDKTRDDLKKMGHGERCKTGRAVAAKSLTDEQKELRKEQLRNNGKKSASIMKSMTPEQRKAHGAKVSVGFAAMSEDEKREMFVKIKSNSLKGAAASKKVRDSMTPEERAAYVAGFSEKSKSWHAALSDEEKVAWTEKVKVGAKNESPESRARRIAGSKKAASRFATMSEEDRKAHGARCRAGRMGKGSEAK